MLTHPKLEIKSNIPITLPNDLIKYDTLPICGILVSLTILINNLEFSLEPFSIINSSFRYDIIFLFSI